MGDSTERGYDFFNRLARAEWDTLLFFYGVVLCVGGLGFIGYLELASSVMYIDYGATFANITVGFLSAIVDNIPVMFAVLIRAGATHCCRRRPSQWPAVVHYAPGIPLHWP